MSESLSATQVAIEAVENLKKRGGGNKLTQVNKAALQWLDAQALQNMNMSLKKWLSALLSDVARNKAHTDNKFATAYLAKLNLADKTNITMKGVAAIPPVVLPWASTLVRDRSLAAPAVASVASVASVAVTAPASAIIPPHAVPGAGNLPGDWGIFTAITGIFQAAQAQALTWVTPNTTRILIASTDASAALTALPTAATLAPKSSPPSTVAEATARLATLETEAQNLVDSGADDEKLEKVEGQIIATKRRLAALQRWAKLANTKTYTEATKDTSKALEDAKDADTFILANFATVEIGNQTYYIANKAKSEKLVALLKTDDSALRDIFVRKMSAVKITMDGQTYPAISTRDAVLGRYKENGNKESLKNAVAFDEKQYDKVLKEFKDIQATPAEVAKTLTQKFIKNVQSNPEQAKWDLRKAIAGDDPRTNTSLDTLLKADFTNPLIDWTNPKISDKITTTIVDILNKKEPAFVMNQYGVAFDGVSLVPGAMVRGKIEWKDTNDGFYETKSSSIDTFLVGISDPDNQLKTVLTSAGDKWPIEFGGKIIEIKNGQVLSLGKPEKPAFTMRDLVWNYSATDGIRDAIILALVIKIWGVPSISLSLPSLSFSLPNLKLAGLKLPSLGSTALHFLGGFGLGWFAASLYYGDNAKIGADTKLYSRYQNASNMITSEREWQLSKQIGDTEYKHMSWDTEGTDRSIKIYRPLGKPEIIGGSEIIAFAIGKDRKVDTTNTLIKSGNEIKSLSTISNSKDIIEAIEA